MNWIRHLYNKLLDATIYFSFDRSGFLRHQKNFKEEIFPNSKGKKVLITGGNSGIGYAAALEFAKLGLEVHIVCRDKQKGSQAIEELKKESNNLSITLHLLDLSELEEVMEFTQNESLPPFDILVNNAGGMPVKKTINSNGKEVIFTSQVLGHALLTKQLIGKNKLKSGSRVIFVSSGGMYLQKLDLSDLNWDKKPYNHYKAYANAKRAQVILSEQLAEKYNHVVFSSMHPGWVDTKGVVSSLPAFYQWMKNRLRKPSEGADTIVWLTLTSQKYPSGKLWFDRKQAAKYYFRWTKESSKERKKLWDLI